MAFPLQKESLLFHLCLSTKQNHYHSRRIDSLHETVAERVQDSPDRGEVAETLGRDGHLPFRLERP